MMSDTIHSNNNNESNINKSNEDDPHGGQASVWRI